MPTKSMESGNVTVTADRAQRLFRMLNLLGKAPQTRQALTKKLRLGIRGFYRDLEVLREIGLGIRLNDGRYHLLEPVAEALARLPFPDAGLTLGEARILARGRLAVHRKIRDLLDRIQK